MFVRSGGAGRDLFTARAKRPREFLRQQVTCWDGGIPKGVRETVGRAGRGRSCSTRVQRSNDEVQ